MPMSRAGASFDLNARARRDCSEDSNDPKGSRSGIRWEWIRFKYRGCLIAGR